MGIEASALRISHLASETHLGAVIEGALRNSPSDQRPVFRSAVVMCARSNTCALRTKLDAGQGTRTGLGPSTIVRRSIPLAPWPNFNSHGRRVAGKALNLLAACGRKAPFLLKCGATPSAGFTHEIVKVD